MYDFFTSVKECTGPGISEHVSWNIKIVIQYDVLVIQILISKLQ